MVNLRRLAKDLGFGDVMDAADRAEQLAFDVDSLLDGTETDELAAILVPVRDFLKNLAGL